MVSPKFRPEEIKKNQLITCKVSRQEEYLELIDCFILFDESQDILGEGSRVGITPGNINIVERKY